MEKKSAGRRLIGLFATLSVFFSLLFATAGFADSAPSKLKIQQIDVKYPELTVFASLTDVSGNAIFPAGNDKVTANINGTNFTPISTDVYSKLKNGAGIVYAIDVSQSMPADKLAAAKNAIAEQINRMSERDFAAVVCIGSEAKVCQEFTNSRDALLKAVEQLETDKHGSELKAGLMRALELATVSNSELPDRKLIVLCTACRDSSSSAITDDELRQKIKSVQIPFYAIVCAPAKNSVANTTKVNLGELSRLSGGDFYQSENVGYVKALDDLNKKIDQSILLKFDIKELKATGAASQLNLVFTNGKVTVSDSAEIRVVQQTEEEKKAAKEELKWHKNPVKKFKAATKKEKIIVCSSAVAVLLLIIAIVCLIVKRSKRKKLEQELQMMEDAGAATVASENYTMGDGATVKMQGSANFDGRTQQVQMPAAAPHGLSVELYHTGSSADQRVIRATVSEHTIIGRKAQGANSVLISNDNTVSSRHCELNFLEGKLYVTDLQSTNGTFVNGVAINGMYPLKDGDVLAVGKTELRVKIVGMN